MELALAESSASPAAAAAPRVADRGGPERTGAVGAAAGGSRRGAPEGGFQAALAAARGTLGDMVDDDTRDARRWHLNDGALDKLSR